MTDYGQHVQPAGMFLMCQTTPSYIAKRVADISSDTDTTNNIPARAEVVKTEKPREVLISNEYLIEI